MAAHRYWRLYVTAVGSGGYVAVEEVAFVGASGTVLSTGGTPSASSVYPGGYTAANAFDRNLNTIWHSNGGSLPEWLAYDFGSAVDIVGLRIMPRRDGLTQSPKDFKLQYSDDASSWTDSFAITGIATWVAGIPQSFPVVDRRAWRLLITGTHGGDACAFSEVEFRATAGGANIAEPNVWGFASASYLGYEGAYGPRKAFDADTSSLWSGSGTPPAHLGYHFGADVTIAQVVLRIRGDSNPEQAPTAFSVQSLGADGSWTTVWSESSIPTWTLGESRTYTNPSGGAQTISPTGIASAEAIGSARLDLTIAAQAIAGAEAFGSASVALAGGAQTASPSAIASSEAFGAARLDLTVSAASIASTEAFGVARADQTVSPSAIASGEAHGAATMGLEIVPTAITSAEAFSAATVINAGTLALSGIPSGEAFGAATLGLHIEPAGIAPAEAVGTPAVGNIVAPASIASAEAFGAAQIDQHVSVTGIVSAETFGVASLSGSITLSPASIGSGETVGQPALVLVIGPPSIGSAEAHGAARLDLEIRPAGITTLEAFGAPRVLALDMFAPDGISSGEAFGLPTTTLYIAPTGITSLAEVGRPTLTGGELNRLSKLVATLTVRAALDGRHSVSATVARG